MIRKNCLPELTQTVIHIKVSKQNGCSFKATKFGVVCYAVAITNWKVTVSWSLVTHQFRHRVSRRKSICT